MMSQGYKCDKCQCWINTGFEFGVVNEIDGTTLKPSAVSGKAPLSAQLRALGQRDVARICDHKHLCRNCTLELLFPEKVEHPKRGGPGDW